MRSADANDCGQIGLDSALDPILKVDCPMKKILERHAMALDGRSCVGMRVGRFDCLLKVDSGCC